MNIHPISNSSKNEFEKKVYQSPELRVFGNISVITQAADKAGNADNGMGKNDKT
jgi:hypothetical protein